MQQFTFSKFSLFGYISITLISLVLFYFVPLWIVSNDSYLLKIMILLILIVPVGLGFNLYTLSREIRLEENSIVFKNIYGAEISTKYEDITGIKFIILSQRMKIELNSGKRFYVEYQIEKYEVFLNSFMENLINKSKIEMKAFDNSFQRNIFLTLFSLFMLIIVYQIYQIDKNVIFLITSICILGILNGYFLFDMEIKFKISEDRFTIIYPFRQKTIDFKEINTFYLNREHNRGYYHHYINAKFKNGKDFKINNFSRDAALIYINLIACHRLYKMKNGSAPIVGRSNYNPL